MRSLRRCFGGRPPALNLLRTGRSEVGAAAPTPIKARDHKHTRERIRTKTCKKRKGQITDFGLGRKSVTSHLRQRRMAEMMRSRSESVMPVPKERQRPRLNKSSATPPPITLALYLPLAFPALLFSSVQRPVSRVYYLSRFSRSSRLRRFQRL